MDTVYFLISSHVQGKALIKENLFFWHFLGTSIFILGSMGRVDDILSDSKMLMYIFSRPVLELLEWKRNLLTYSTTQKSVPKD